MTRGMTNRSRLLRHYIGQQVGLEESDQTLVFGFFDGDGQFMYCSPHNVRQMVQKHKLFPCLRGPNIGYYVESGDARRKVDLRGLDVDELLAEGRTVM